MGYIFKNNWIYLAKIMGYSWKNKGIYLARSMGYIGIRL